MTTTAVDIKALALRLAGATKMCPRTDRHTHEDIGFTPGVRSSFTNTKGGACICEVYVLPNEVRVECENSNLTFPHPSLCQLCQGRSWAPLDPRFLGEWMVALEPIAWVRLNVGLRGGWQFLIELKRRRTIGAGETTLNGTPEEAFLQAAVRALGLDEAVEAEKQE